MIFVREIFLGMLVLNVQKLQALLNQMKLTNFASLASDVKNFYICSSVIIVYDCQFTNEWEFQESAFILARELSSQNVMSQVIKFATLNITMNTEIGMKPAHPANPIFLLYIHNSGELEFFRKLTTERDVSFFKWFVFIDNKANLNCEVPEGNPFNLKMDSRMIVKCEDSPKIRKYFSFLKNTTEVVDIALWNPSEGLIWINKDMLIQLKKDMKGIALKTVKSEEKTVIFHYLDEIVNTLANFSNFKPESIAEEKRFDNFNRTKPQSITAVELMDQEKADIAVSMVITSTYRMDIVDFVVPLIRSQRKFYLKLPGTVRMRWSAYFEVFDRNAWASIGIFLILFSILLMLVKNKNYRLISVHSFIENVINVFGIYCQQGLPELPGNGPLKILYFCIVNFSLILYIIYSAKITSYISTLTIDLPFVKYNELLSDKTFKITILRNSQDENLIRTNDWLGSLIKHKVREKNDLPNFMYEGFLQACEDNVAFYAPEILFEILGNRQPCTLGWLEVPRVEYVGIALAKNSAYKETINYQILRLINHGIISRLKLFYFHKLKEIPELKPNIITISQVIPILTIWFMGVAITWIIFYIEILFYRNSLV